jgi:hypothetical protein
MKIIVVVSKPNKYDRDGVRLMTPRQVLKADGLKIDDYVLSSEVLHNTNADVLKKIDDHLSNAMVTSNVRL